jgi:hypothetical protein
MNLLNLLYLQRAPGRRRMPIRSTQRRANNAAPTIHFDLSVTLS